MNKKEDKSSNRGDTISITIPKKLNKKLKKAAKNEEMSRSKFIGYILMDWSKKQ